jgi:pimeloyl-ACP methyl ester carboxylesterase
MFDHPLHVDPHSDARRLVHGTGAPSVILLHGLTATPRQFDALAPRIHAAGRNVLVPRLPRHGYHNRMTRALSTLEVTELIAAVKLALREAREFGGPVTVAGFSLGGLLAAYAAQCEDVARAVCIAPFFGVRWLPRVVNRSGAEIFSYLPNLYFWWNPLKRQGHGERDGYPCYPISAVHKAFVLTRAIFEHARENTPRAHTIVVMTNPRETTCHNGIVEELAALWRAKGASVEELEILGHGPSHDFMTPRRGREALRERVYPGIVKAILG